MGEQPFSRLCDAELSQFRDRQFAELTKLFAGSRKTPIYARGITGMSMTDQYTDPERWVHECLSDLNNRACVLADHNSFRPLVVQCDLYGVHFVDRIFGAHIYEADGNWWVHSLAKPVGLLEPPDLDHNSTWQLAQTIARAFVDSKVSVPIFGLPTIASPLNIAVNLYGEDFLVAMAADPAAARHDLEIINDVLCQLHRWYLQHIPLQQLQPVIAVRRIQPPGYGQLCGCTTHLISGSMYADLIAPLDDALLRVYPNGGMIHLCGAHAQHIPVWREMRSVRALQLNDRAVDDLELYFKGLRHDQIVYVRPTAKMPLRTVLEVTGGRRLVVMGQSPDGVCTEGATKVP